MRGVALLLCLLSTVVAHAEGDTCSSNQQCAPYEICTVSVGECGSGAGNADVCTGTCEMGRRFRIVPYLGGAAGRATDYVTVGYGFAGVELIPPILGGHLSASAEFWTGSAWRVGVGSPWAPISGLRLTPRVDALIRPNGTTGAMVGLRLDYFPWMPFNSLTPAHYFSIALEGGTTLDALAFPYGALSLRIWL